MNDKTVALVTGASGFVGSHLAETLAAQKTKVKMLVRKTSRIPFSPTPEMEFCYRDVTDPNSVRTAMKGVTLVYHVAGLRRGADYSAYERVNAEGTRNVCQAAAEGGTVKRLVYVSSLSAAGPSALGEEIDETAPCHPISFYGMTKRQGEVIALGFQDKFDVVVLRPAAVYGPRETDIFEYFKMVRSGLVVNGGDGKQPVSFIYVADVVEATLLAGRDTRARQL